MHPDSLTTTREKTTPFLEIWEESLQESIKVSRASRVSILGLVVPVGA
jgi:hypothetical protein